MIFTAGFTASLTEGQRIHSNTLRRIYSKGFPEGCTTGSRAAAATTEGFTAGFTEGLHQ